MKGDTDTVTDFQQVCESGSMWTKTDQGTYLYFQKAFVQVPHSKLLNKVTMELEYMSYSDFEIWLKDGSREYSLMVTSQGGEKSAMLSSRNVWVYRCCFMQQSLIFINDPEKEMHTE